MMSIIAFLALASACSAAVVHQLSSLVNLGGFPASNFGSVNFDNFDFGSLGNPTPAESPEGGTGDPVVNPPAVTVAPTDPPVVTNAPAGPGPPVANNPFTSFNFFGGGQPNNPVVPDPPAVTAAPTTPPAVTAAPADPNPPVAGNPFSSFNFFGADQGVGGNPANNVPDQGANGADVPGGNGGGFNFPAGFGGGGQTFGGQGFGGGFGFR